MGSPFLVNVADLSRADAGPRSLRLEMSVEWGLELSRLRPQPPLRAELVLSPTSGGVVVTGTVTAEAEHTCHRCLEETIEPLQVQIAQLVTRPRDDEDDADYQLIGDELDLEPVLRDEVLLAMPLQPTCEDGCRQLVGEPETGLNTSTPGDDSSPFAVLRDLFESEE